MNLEVGMYCYDKIHRELGIGKIIEFRRNNNAVIKYKNGCVLTSIGNIIASHKLIDLIETGDIVEWKFGLTYLNEVFIDDNGEKCVFTDAIQDYFNLKNDFIKSIVTKEQFNSMKYEVGE